jgi:hypothetical protein
MATHRRRIKIIRPRLQLKLTLTFVGLTLLALMLQFMIFLRTMTVVAASLPSDHDMLMEAVPEVVFQSLMLTFCVVVPLVFLVGVLMTFRIAGPIHRFESYIKQILRGENPGECRLRKGDELNELCDLINQVTLPVREGLERPQPEVQPETERKAA